MCACIHSFLKSESGAITVDWVVLTAAMVTLGFAVVAVVADGYNDVSNSVSDEMVSQSTTVGDHPFGRTVSAP